MNQSYMAERRAFDRLRSDCSDIVKREYELACGTVVERYNTTLRENRFIAGGAVEIFTCALLRSVGIECTLYANHATDGDILLPNHKLLSVKATFAGGPKTVKLMNKLGASRSTWKTATLFIFSEIGIVYGDPTMIDPKYVVDTGDGLELKRRGVIELIESPDDNVFPMDLPRKPPTEMAGFSHKASASIARGIMFEMKTTELLKAFPD